MDHFSFDAFGNPVERVNGKPRPTAADAAAPRFGGAHDPALAPFTRRFSAAAIRSARFTSLDNHEGQVQDPAGLMKFLYAGRTPVDRADPV